MNDAIGKFRIQGAETIYDLALKLGPSLDIKAVESLSGDTDNNKFAKRLGLSLLVNGWSRNPGVSEIVLAQQAGFFIAATSAACLRGLDVDYALKTGMFSAGITSLAIPIAFMHEVVHDYSRERHHDGIIPAKLTTLDELNNNIEK